MPKKKKKATTDLDPMQSGASKQTKIASLSRLKSKLTPLYKCRRVERPTDSQGSGDPPTKIPRLEQGQEAIPSANITTNNPPQENPPQPQPQTQLPHIPQLLFQPQLSHIPPLFNEHGNPFSLDQVFRFPLGAIDGQAQPPIPRPILDTNGIQPPPNHQIPFQLSATTGQTQQGYPPPPFFYSYPYLYPPQLFYPPNPVAQASPSTVTPPAAYTPPNSIAQATPSAAAPQAPQLNSVLVSIRNNDAKLNQELNQDDGVGAEM
ncbi:hypothetical protein NP233_g11797 [Leucocoprinus birnbaumii]|uniref:Uncharacterized protein n=1 Tax=Leucocoprinus birnbaumii TaxID=56174 RepID=A0AAD5VG36_9AGAR|nr:hypothetical protein NP233_g11797 [Leucocoprinus birnbaumii]